MKVTAYFSQRMFWKLCDNIIMIKKGHDIYQGTLDDLVAAHKNKSLEDIFIEMTHEE